MYHSARVHKQKLAKATVIADTGLNKLMRPHTEQSRSDGGDRLVLVLGRVDRRALQSSDSSGSWRPLRVTSCYRVALKADAVAKERKVGDANDEKTITVWELRK